MNTTLVLLVLILLLLVVATGLLVVLLVRRADHGGEAIERALREEQRDGRGELRQQLDAFALAQAQRTDAFGAQLQAATTRTDQRLDEFTLRTDARLDAFTRTTDERLDLLRAALNEDARKARIEGAEQQQRFADALGARLDRIGGRAPVVRLHNDAVVQGLSERPRMAPVARWGVLTIGTGLGNASYTNHPR